MAQESNVNLIPEKPAANSHDQIVALASGVVRQVPISNIDRELGKLWKDSFEAENIARASVYNTLIYSRNDGETEQARELARFLMARHPSRTIIIQADPNGPARLESYITVLCQRGNGDGQTRCCEQITLVAGGGEVEKVPNTVLGLLVTDVPVCLLWLGDPPFGRSLYRSLARTSDYLVFDSAEFRDPLEELAQLATRIQRSYALSDLNWARITSWRALVAQFFDGQAAGQHLQRINQVHVHYGGDKQHNPLQSLLLVGWLASRLSWSVGKGGVSGETAQETLIMNAPNKQQITINLRAVDPVEETPGGLVEVRLCTPDAEFAITHVPSEMNACVMTSMRNIPRIERIVPLAAASKAELLDQQLELLGRDHIYEQALALSARLVVL